jgi:hypothetical protein
LTEKDKSIKISVMASFRANRILPAIFIVIITIIAVTALVSIARAIFFNGTSMSKVDISQQALLSTSADRSVQLSVRGPIVADENFESYVINITPNTRSLTTYVGYGKAVTNSIVLPNTVPSYEQFVYALNRANLVKGTPLVGDANDVRGVCATGELYTFDVLEGAQVIKELWTTNCSGSEGSLNANLDQLINLFSVQIPNAQTTIDKTNL